MIVPFAGTYILYKHQKRLIRKEIKHKIIAGIDKSELVLINVHNSKIEIDLEWEHSKEFEYKGEMYDVVSRETSGDTTSFWCWWDYDETSLNKQLTASLSKALGHDTKTKNTQNRLQNFLKALYFEDNSKSDFNSFKENEHNSQYLANYFERYSSPAKPPPEKVNLGIKV